MQTPQNLTPPLPPKARKQDEAKKDQRKIRIGSDAFIINHAYTGTHTIREVYEDFLKRAITNG